MKFSTTTRVFYFALALALIGNSEKVRVSAFTVGRPVRPTSTATIGSGTTPSYVLAKAVPEDTEIQEEDPLIVSKQEDDLEGEETLEANDDDDDEEEDGSSNNEKDSNKQITHLQKKLRYWKQEQKTKEMAYKQYIVQHAIDHKTKPICIREGKIDHYRSPPIFDQETERIQTEVWTIKNQIKLVGAKLHEERRIIEVRKETASKLEQHDAEVSQLKIEAKQQQERIRKEASAKMQELQDQSQQRLAEKEEEIDTLAQEIQNLISTLQEKRSQLKRKENDLENLEHVLEDKEYDLANLEHELEGKEAVLNTLKRERASIRSLVRQSWKVLKSRFKRKVLRRGKQEDDNVLNAEIDDAIAAATTPTTMEVTTNGGEAKSKVMVR